MQTIFSPLPFGKALRLFPQGQASVMISHPVSSRLRSKLLLTVPCSFSNNATTHAKLEAIRLVCTNFPAVRLVELPPLTLPSYVASLLIAAQSGDRNGLITGTKPATKDREPASDLRTLSPTTGDFSMALHSDKSFVTLSSGIVTSTFSLSLSMVMEAPIHFTVRPDEALDSFNG